MKGLSEYGYIIIFRYIQVMYEYKAENRARQKLSMVFLELAQACVK